MNKETVIAKEFFELDVRALSECGYICATDITKAYNERRKDIGLTPKQFSEYFELKSTKDFMIGLRNELNSKANKTKTYYTSSLKMVKKGKNNTGIWLHPCLFIDYAMWLSPEFKTVFINTLNKTLCNA